MRALALCLALAPSALWADDIPLTSAVAAVTLYPDGATITRQVPFDMPAGRHRLILADLPQTTPLQAVRVEVAGATLGSVTARSDFVPPRSPLKDAVLEAAEARVEELEEQLRKGEAEVRAIRLEVTAAQARADFLGRIGAGGGPLPVDTQALLDLSAMIKGTTLAALREAHEAEARAAAADRALDDLRDELADARQTLAALVPEDEARAYLAVAVSSEAATSGQVTITYPIANAGWTPVYDLRLDRAEGALTIERGAFVMQETGENWDNVALTLSTVRPSEQVAPSEVRPELRRIGDPVEPFPRSRMAIAEDAPNVAVEAAPAPAFEMAKAESDGISVRYSYPTPVD
ncbi:MAG: mucoidy inhibitor MuiA family protein, partial [Rhodovulum sp.]